MLSALARSPRGRYLPALCGARAWAGTRKAQPVACSSWASWVSNIMEAREMGPCPSSPPPLLLPPPSQVCSLLGLGPHKDRGSRLPWPTVPSCPHPQKRYRLSLPLLNTALERKFFVGRRTWGYILVQWPAPCSNPSEVRRPQMLIRLLVPPPFFP